jgi:tetratricopeptide (TPR) repeat protein
MSTWITLAMAALVAALASSPTPANDSLASARDLYAAAEYEDALAVLNRLPTGETGDDLRTISQYRAYCLLALGRGGDAVQAIEAVVLADPLYQPSGAEVSPRVRSAFSDVRRRLLPQIIRGKYAAAKAVFEAGDFAQARDAFAIVLAAMTDPDVAPLAGQPAMADLAILATGFRDLSSKSAQPVPLVSRRESTAAMFSVAAPRIYGSDDPNVVAPVVIRQALPVFSSLERPAQLGVLELLVGESGAVEKAVMRATVSPRYDRLLLDATKDWLFAPATLRGVPVRYRKTVQVAVKP